MAISKVWIEEGCTACGLCEEICPEVFRMEDEATVIEGVNYADFEEGIKENFFPCQVSLSFSLFSTLATNSKFFNPHFGAMSISGGAWLIKRSTIIFGFSNSR
jgi:ferredoxin